MGKPKKSHGTDTREALQLAHQSDGDASDPVRRKLFASEIIPSPKSQSSDIVEVETAAKHAVIAATKAAIANAKKYILVKDHDILTRQTVGKVPTSSAKKKEKEKEAISQTSQISQPENQPQKIRAE